MLNRIYDAISSRAKNSLLVKDMCQDEHYFGYALKMFFCTVVYSQWYIKNFTSCGYIVGGAAYCVIANYNMGFQYKYWRRKWQWYQTPFESLFENSNCSFSSSKTNKMSQLVSFIFIFTYVLYLFVPILIPDNLFCFIFSLLFLSWWLSLPLPVLNMCTLDTLLEPTPTQPTLVMAMFLLILDLLFWKSKLFVDIKIFLVQNLSRFPNMFLDF